MNKQGNVVIVLSNGHFSPFQKKLHPRASERVKDWLREKTLKKVRSIINESRDALVISNGDLIECSNPERGLRYDKDVEAFKESNQDLKARIGAENMVFNAGNHELGFTGTTLARDPQGGISQKSIDNFLSLAGRKTLWHSFDTGKYWIVLVPYLLPQEKPAEGEVIELNSLKRELLDWLESVLEEATKPVILMAHDPETLADERFFAIVKRFENKIGYILFGHHHSWLALWLSRFLWQKKGMGYSVFKWTLRPLVRYAAKKLKGEKSLTRADRYFGHGGTAEKILLAVKSMGAVLVPSPVGMFFVGRGFITIDLDTGELRVRK